MRTLSRLCDWYFDWSSHLSPSFLVGIEATLNLNDSQNWSIVIRFGSLRILDSRIGNLPSGAIGMFEFCAPTSILDL
jgi:hypothetical protein